MSDNETDITDIEKVIRSQQIEEISNLHLSQRLEIYKNSNIGHGERDRGILSKTDREYLLGLKNYENKQSEANRRQDIRNRLRNSLRDFKIIWPLLDQKDRAQVFTSSDDNVIDDSVEAMISLVYLGLNQDIPRLEKAIKRGILAGENVNPEGDAKNIDVSININYYPDVEDAKEKMKKHPLTDLTVEEIGVLAKANELNPEHIEKLNDSYVHPPPGYFGEEDIESYVNKEVPVWTSKKSDGNSEPHSDETQ